MEGLISIIVPVFNGEKTIEYCLKSALMQSYSDIEIILVDDGSTDNTREICLSMRQKDSRISYNYQNNAGVSLARNKGLDLAKGEYIFFLDSDDAIMPTLLYELKYLTEKYSADLACSDYLFVSSLEDIRRKLYNDVDNEIEKKIYILDRENSLIEVLKPGHKIIRTCSGKLYRRERIHSLFNPKYNLAEDTLFLIEYMKTCKKVIVCSSKQYIYMYDQHKHLNTERQLVNYSIYSLIEEELQILKNKRIQRTLYFRILGANKEILKSMIDNRNISFRTLCFVFRNVINNVYKIIANI